MKTLAEFKQFVEEINLENGRNYKISILEKYKDNLLLVAISYDSKTKEHFCRIEKAQ